jgi:hypothetical protein
LTLGQRVGVQHIAQCAWSTGYTKAQITDAAFSENPYADFVVMELDLVELHGGFFRKVRQGSS